MAARVELPFRKPRAGRDPRFQPHVLIITDPGDGSEKEWEIEHHECCPRICHWWPGAAEELAREKARGWISFAVETYDCYVQFELDHNGIDSLAVVSHRELGPGGTWVDVAEFADPAYVPETGFEAEWHRLRPGRYLIEGWYQSGAGQGEYGGMGDAEGGLTILGLAP